MSMPTKSIPTVESLNELGIEIKSEFVPWSKSRSFDPKVGLDVSKKNLNWKVTLVFADRDILTTDYSAGIGHAPSYKNYDPKKHGMKWSIVHASYLEDEVEKGITGEGAPAAIGGATWRGKPVLPDAVDVVASLLLDGSAIDHPTYEEYAWAMGMDEDSRKGYEMYQERLKIGLMLRTAFGDKLLNQLREDFQDY